jgi:hypothetical protein
VTLWKWRKEVGYHQPAVSVNITTTRTSFRRRKLNLPPFFFRGAEVGRLFDHTASPECARRRSVVLSGGLSHRVRCTQCDGRHTEETGCVARRRTHLAARIKCVLATVFGARYVVRMNDVRFSGSQYTHVFFAQLFLSLISV